MAPYGYKLREEFQRNRKTLKTVLIYVFIVTLSATVIIIVVYYLVKSPTNFEEVPNADSEISGKTTLDLNKSFSIRIWTSSQPDSDFPFMVFLALDWGTPQQSFCGGTIIDKRHILTSAHCLYIATSVDIIVGLSQISNVTDSRMSGGRFIIHEDYDDKNYDNDIGLIQFDNADVGLEDGTDTVFLNFANNAYRTKVARDSVVLGWGLNEDLGLDEKLHIKRVNLVDNEECATYYQQDNFVYNDSKIICTVSSEEGPCFSDSGGPLLLQDTQIGVLSGGDKNCAPRTPTRYMNVAYYRKWIEKHIL